MAKKKASGKVHLGGPLILVAAGVSVVALFFLLMMLVGVSNVNL